MKFRKLLTLALLLAGGATASAQSTERYPIGKTFSDNLYIDAGAGIQTMFASDWKDISFGKLITPSFTLGIGKMFSPFWGLHFDVYGYSANGYRSHSLGDLEPFGPLNEVDVDHEGRFRYYQRYCGVRGDFRFNIVNLCARNANKRVYELTALVGMGYKRMIAYRGTTSKNLITAHVGLRNSFRVHDRLDINLDLISEISDGYMNPVGRTYVPDMAVNVGLSVYLGKCAHRNPVVSVPMEVVRYRTDTVLVREVPVEGKREVIETVKAERTNMVMGSIRFHLNHTTPIANQGQQLLEISQFLKANPDAKVCIEGYADATSGSEKLNKRLSADRAQVVYDELVHKYGVDKNQLKMKAMSLDVQPYPGEPVWNCVTLIRLVK